jgi:hypothetical protein
MPDLVTIASYNDPISATFAQHKLEEHGIDSYIADEMTIAMQWTLMNALGGIKLRVSTADAEEAMRILREQNTEVETEKTIDESSSTAICPSCGSNNTGTETLSRRFAGWTWLLLGVPLLWPSKKQHSCFYCGHRWKS